MEDYPETDEVAVGIFQLANKHLFLTPYMYLPY